MICPQCKSENPASAIFCINCRYNFQSMHTNEPPLQQQYQNQDAQNQPSLQRTPAKPGKGASTASLVCGIIGLLASFVITVDFDQLIARSTINAVAYIIGGFLIPAALSIIAIVKGRKAKKLGYIGGKATAGFVLGIIAAAITGLRMFSLILLLLLAQ